MVFRHTRPLPMPLRQRCPHCLPQQFFRLRVAYSGGVTRRHTQSRVVAGSV